MTTIYEVLDHLRDAALSESDKGYRFEKLVQAYLRVDPVFSEQFSHVWMWGDWPGNGGKHDTGIDLVAETRGTGDLVAIQCKFFAPSTYVTKPMIDSFLAASGTNDFAERIIVSTTEKWNSNAELTIKIAAEARYKGVTGDVGCSFGLGEKKKITAESLSKSMTMRATGGETLLADAPREWVPTVAHPEKWAVIAVRGFKPLIEWFDPETRDKLKQIWAYAQPAIGPLQEVDTQDRVLMAASGSRFVLAARRAVENIPHLGRVKLACATSTSRRVR